MKKSIHHLWVGSVRCKLIPPGNMKNIGSKKRIRVGRKAFLKPKIEDSVFF
jgi:hypothetical protein